MPMQGWHPGFAAERIGPAMAAAGESGPPDIHEFPVHEYLA
jgi:hypothetical protein